MTLPGIGHDLSLPQTFASLFIIGIRCVRCLQAERQVTQRYFTSYAFNDIACEHARVRAQARGLGANVKSSGEAAGETRQWACFDLWNLFYFHPGNNFFRRKYELWQLRFLGEIVKFFFITTWGTISVVDKVLRSWKNRKSLYLARTYTWFQVVLLWQSGLRWCWK